VNGAFLMQDPALLCALTHPQRIAPCAVHVWSFHLAASASCLEECRQSLSPSEQARAQRFVAAQDRDDFIVAHGVLRHLLALYSGDSAADLSFSVAASGKPSLAAHSDTLSFNLTHAQGCALIAVSDGQQIGVDLEKADRQVKALAIAQRYFAPTERQAIESAPAAARGEVFFRYWVAKEAVLKGAGIGLQFPIDEFEVQFDAQGQSARIRTGEGSTLGSDWMIRMLPVEEGWAAAMAARGSNWTLCLEGASNIQSDSFSAAAVPPRR
jgi:4'-phosphopantetheinyl transferase